MTAPEPGDPQIVLKAGSDISAEERARLAERWKAAWERDKRKPRLRVYPPLPRRVRLHLWLEHGANSIGIWLVDHGHYCAAIAFWHACGMWRRPALRTPIASWRVRRLQRGHVVQTGDLGTWSAGQNIAGPMPGSESGSSDHDRRYP